jgi:hypothetical protein
MLDLQSFAAEKAEKPHRGGNLAQRPTGALGETGVAAGSGGVQITLGGFVIGALIGAGAVYAWKEGMFR